jgi:hypothetical protein
LVAIQRGSKRREGKRKAEKGKHDPNRHKEKSTYKTGTDRRAEKGKQVEE